MDQLGLDMDAGDAAFDARDFQAASDYYMSTSSAYYNLLNAGTLTGASGTLGLATLEVGLKCGDAYAAFSGAAAAGKTSDAPTWLLLRACNEATSAQGCDPGEHVSVQRHSRT